MLLRAEHCNYQTMWKLTSLLCMGESTQPSYGFTLEIEAGVAVTAADAAVLWYVSFDQTSG